jgi:hypothetical protein
MFACRHLIDALTTILDGRAAVFDPSAEQELLSDPALQGPDTEGFGVYEIAMEAPWNHKR